MQIQYKYNTSTIQMQYKNNTNTIQILYKYYTKTTQTQFKYKKLQKLIIPLGKTNTMIATANIPIQIHINCDN